MSFKKTSYYQISGNTYLSTVLNKGRLGEYLIYEKLSFLEWDEARFLCNLYIPNGKGSTTELDVVMISKSGVYVFESKNCIFSFSGNSHPTAFQTYLYEDETPFCFFGSSGQVASTVVHEIGHYYAAYTNPDIDNYDLCETHSQGNEFLFLTFCKDYLKEDVYRVSRAYQLVNACYVMIMATIIDEYEQNVYELDDETVASMTGEDFDAIMTQVCAAYGGAPWVESVVSDPYSYWRLVCISNPVYYISYAVSASAALNILALAEVDYDAALESYTKLVENITPEDGFLGALAKAGLTTPFEEETFMNIGEVLAK